MRDLAAFLLAFFLLALVCGVTYLYLDHPVSEFFYYYQDEGLLRFFNAFTFVFNPLLVLIIGLLMLSAGYFHLFASRREGLNKLIRITGWSIVLSLFLALLLKIFICRPRPLLMLEDGITAGSGIFCMDTALHALPSGHTVAVTALLLPAMMNLNNRLLWLAGLLVIGMVAVGRVVLLEHYLTDVISGVFLAAFIVHLVQARSK